MGRCRLCTEHSPSTAMVLGSCHNKGHVAAVPTQGAGNVPTLVAPVSFYLKSVNGAPVNVTACHCHLMSPMSCERGKAKVVLSGRRTANESRMAAALCLSCALPRGAGGGRFVVCGHAEECNKVVRQLRAGPEEGLREMRRRLRAEPITLQPPPGGCREEGSCLFSGDKGMGHEEMASRCAKEVPVGHRGEMVRHGDGLPGSGESPRCGYLRHEDTGTWLSSAL